MLGRHAITPFKVKEFRERQTRLSTGISDVDLASDPVSNDYAPNALGAGAGAGAVAGVDASGLFAGVDVGRRGSSVKSPESNRNYSNRISVSELTFDFDGFGV